MSRPNRAVSHLLETLDSHAFDSGSLNQVVISIGSRYKSESFEYTALSKGMEQQNEPWRKKNKRPPSLTQNKRRKQMRKKK